MKNAIGKRLAKAVASTAIMLALMVSTIVPAFAQPLDHDLSLLTTNVR
jgi:hypothetical protein